MSDHNLVTHEEDFSKKTVSTYLLGIFLALVLTIAAFVLVEKQMLTTMHLYISLAVLAIIQFFVQSVCFLGLNYTRAGRWNVLPYIFAIIIIMILVGGTLWIMYNLNYNMVH